MDDDIQATNAPVPGPAEEQTVPFATAPVESGESGEPAGSVEHVAPTESVAPTVATSPPPLTTPWWSAAAATGTVASSPPAPSSSGPRRTSNSRAVAIAALVGALVAALVSSLLFVTLDDDSSSSSSGTTVPLGVTGANASGTVPLRTGNGSQIDVHAVLARIQPAVVRIRITTADGDAAGTGIVIDPNGTIVTNAHVVNDAQTIQVQLPNGDLVPAKAKGVDSSDDLAVVTIARHGLASAVLGDSDALSVGDPVIAVGNALNLGISVTSGIISAIDRDVPEPSGSTLLGALQTDAAINPGNSGGPLVNSRGEVIGINTAIAPPSDATNVGFAIAISAAKPIITDLATGRTPHNALLGVASREVTPQLVAQQHLKVNSGVWVEQVDGNPDAVRAGIRKGDVIVALDGKPVTTTEQMRRYIRRHRPGDKVNVEFVTTSGDRKTVTVTLGTAK